MMQMPLPLKSTITDQGRLIGNSVCPSEAAALVKANATHLMPRANPAAIAAAE
ncbi:hypothetical protein P7L78_22190 [Tistrella bauzanensis]|uniref:hypothetical protein n=1 Tax=Tistrella TaxID=171436 RepID=UPI0031F5F2B3